MSASATNTGSPTSFQCATAPNTVFTSREELHEQCVLPPLVRAPETPPRRRARSYKSDWHRYNLRRRAAGLAPIDKQVFERVRLAAETKTMLEEAAEKDKKRDHVKPRVAAAAEAASPTTSEQPGAPSEAAIAAEVAKAVEAFAPNPCRCIWNDGEFADTAANLAHMLSAHGFLVPDMDAVADLDGLVNYCAEKVHVGRICLLCDKAFASGGACVEHMLAKGHCRLAWEFEDEVEEFEDFYDFAAAADRAAGADRGTMEVDGATGELVLTDPDGKVQRFGPGREFRSVYRHAREATRPADVSVAAVSMERALQVYRGAGVATSSAIMLVPGARQRVVRAKHERQHMVEKRHRWEIKKSLQQNWLQKHAVAGTNVGAGHGVHG
jgi:hypothetical protein